MTIERREISSEEYNLAVAWLQQGVEKGWVSEGFCYTHDGDPYLTAEEEQEWEDGGDPCSPVVKWLI
jgi:hypothetical protein